MRIHVTFWDILLGDRREQTSCALARAISRQVPELAHVQVGQHVVNGFGPTGTLYATLPDVASQKVYAFDRHRFIWPFSFELPELRPWQEGISVAQQSEFAELGFVPEDVEPVEELPIAA